METVKLVKSWTGWREPKEDEDYTHVRLDREQYRAYIKEIEDLKTELKKTKYYADQDIRNAEKEADQRIKAANEDAHNRILEAQAEMESWKQEAADMENKNKNLVRICKERANADRKLQPKKQRSGYVLQNMDQTVKTFFFVSGKKRQRLDKRCWKIKLQTPYEALMDYTSVNQSVTEDLLESLGSSIGLETIYASLDDKSMEQIDALWYKDSNFMFDASYKLNAVRGYWEVEFYTRYSIQVIPDILAKQKD